MNPSKHSLIMLPFLFVFLTLFSCTTSDSNEQFFQCLSAESSDIIFTPTNTSYTSILVKSIQNLRFNTTDTPKPLAIVTPLNASHVQATVTCATKYNIQIRIRSGGHDNEGLSYVSSLPFVMVDLNNLRNITVDVENKVAWVKSGADIGELPYRIAEKSRTLAFPAGSAITVGIGGHLSGGGYGYLWRKYGLAADNVIDARLVDVNGTILDRASMGEDLFWAIRGGGGNTFGIDISWKLNLVQVPPTVTYCTVAKSLEDNTIPLLKRWQYIASKLPDDLHILAKILNQNKTRSAIFESLYLGGIDSLLLSIKEWFPEIDLKREECSEMSWIESLVLLAGFPSNKSLDVLLSRINIAPGKFKYKSDNVKEPIQEAALDGLAKLFINDELELSELFMVPYGGKMDEIAETSVPFPHRAGNLYMMLYKVLWNDQSTQATEKHIGWMRNVYSYMAPYVSKNTREAYLNLRDLDLGANDLSGNTSYRQASIWGAKYFKNNFDRVVKVKTTVDSSNFFRNEQSAPPLSTW